MEISIFDGSEDAYWWIICSEKSFNTRRRIVSAAERLMECCFAMKGSALKWWVSWYFTHPKRSWDSFTCALLWQFKPEWGLILSGEKEDELKQTQAEEPTKNEAASEPHEEEEPVITIILPETQPKNEKKQEFRTHHDSLSISLSPKPPTTTQLPSVADPEILVGPLTFINDEYNGSLPNLALRSISWTKVSNIIFIDLPAGTGYSYPKTETAVQQSTWKFVHNAHQFLRKWLIDHPKFISNEVYIAGESYSGIPVPIIVQEISYGNDDGLQPWINLQGYILGNPITTPKDDNYQIPFNHGMALISDELYQSLEKNCRGEYKHIDPQNVFCLKDFQSYEETISRVYVPHILEPDCESDFVGGIEVPRRTLLINKANNTVFSSSLTMPPLNCRTHAYFLSSYWTNDDNVGKALHIRKGSIGKWKRCNNDIPFKHEILNSFPYHANLSRNGFRSLIYSGDHDMRVPFLATQAWIRSLNYSIVHDWRQWYSNAQIAGYTRTYSNRMTFATVKGGGHTAPEFKPEECLAMFSRWISNKPL